MVLPRVLTSLALSLAFASLTFALDLPRKAPELVIQMNQGKPLQLSQYRGRAVVLAFILTTCPHCQKAIACLTKDLPEFAPRGLQVLASAVDADAAKLVPGFIQKFNPPFPVGFSPDPIVVLDFLQHPRAVIPHMPLLAFIDKDGMIRAQLEGDAPILEEKVIEQNLHQQIDDLLKGPAASKNAKPAVILKKGS